MTLSCTRPIAEKKKKNFLASYRVQFLNTVVTQIWHGHFGNFKALLKGEDEARIKMFWREFISRPFIDTKSIKKSI